MNKGITLLILGVIGCAMGLVLYTQSKQLDSSIDPKVIAPIVNNATAGSNDIVQILPPVSNTPLQPPVITTPSYEGSKIEAQAEPRKEESQKEIAKNEVKTSKDSEEVPSLTPPLAMDQKREPLKNLPVANKSTSNDTSPKNEKVKDPVIKKDVQMKNEQKNTLAPTSDMTTNTASSHKLTTFTVTHVGAKTIIRLQANSAFSYKTMLLSAPNRLVVDLPGKWEGIKAPASPQNNLLEKIRIGSQPSGHRLVFDLKSKPKKYGVFKINSTTFEFVIE